MQWRRRASRGRPDQQCPRRGQSQEWRQVARAEDIEGRARSSQNALKPGFGTVILAGANVGAHGSGVCG
jgi:hypothetical protein